MVVIDCSEVYGNVFTIPECNNPTLNYPYPTSFHPPNTALFDAWVTRVRQSWRSTLMVFAGGGGSSSSPNIRRSIRLECENNANSSETNDGYSKSCEFIDCSNGVCEHDSNRFMRPMLQSKFCLQPPGDTPSRRSTFDRIIAGCIPVFFENQSAKIQYTWHLPEDKYSDFSVYIPKEDLVFKGVKILDVLLGIPRDEVRRMRESSGDYAQSYVQKTWKFTGSEDEERCI